MPVKKHGKRDSTAIEARGRTGLRSKGFRQNRKNWWKEQFLIDKLNFRTGNYHLHSVLSHSEPDERVRSRSRSFFFDAISLNACVQPALGFIRERMTSSPFSLPVRRSLPTGIVLKEFKASDPEHERPREIPFQSGRLPSALRTRSATQPLFRPACLYSLPVVS